MALLIQLPPELEKELAAEEGRAGVPASVQATFFVQLMSALIRVDRKSPFRSVIKAYLRQSSVDAERLGDVFEGLMTLCLGMDGSQFLASGQETPGSNDSLENGRIISLLRGWQSPEANLHLDDDVEISVHDLPPLKRLIQRAGRMNRVSALGSLAHLDFSSEDFIAEKRLETDREDRL